jgi:Fe-S-cluster containining protein
MARKSRGQELAKQRMQEEEQRRRAAIAAKREAARNASLAGSVAAKRRAYEPRPSVGAAVEDADTALTFGQFLERSGLIHKVSAATRRLISMVSEQAEELARHEGTPVSCKGCTAVKGCCKISTFAYLHEAAPIAWRLIREARDTPQFRDQLREAAEAMEGTPRGEYERPCIFLSPGERCTIYEDRPVECGTHFVFSPPELCSSTEPGVLVTKFPSGSPQIQSGMDVAFVSAARLRVRPHSHLGALPRMVLLCLEAWNRPDYADFLGKQVGTAAMKFMMALDDDLDELM